VHSVCDSVVPCVVEENVNLVVEVAKDRLQQCEYRSLQADAQHQFSRTRYEGTNQPFVGFELANSSYMHSNLCIHGNKVHLLV